jgi:anti-anti-sigma factor
VTTFLAHQVECDDLDVAEQHTDRLSTGTDRRTLTVTAVSSGQGCVTVALHGQLDSATALVLFGQLAFFFVGDPSAVVADMSDVTFIDDDGVTSLVDARQALRLRSCDLTVREPSATVRQNLELAHLSHLIER